jgi:hypothetical protein
MRETSGRLSKTLSEEAGSLTTSTIAKIVVCDIGCLVSLPVRHMARRHNNAFEAMSFKRRSPNIKLGMDNKKSIPSNDELWMGCFA